MMRRLLATSLLVALCATVATAWLAVRTTTRAIRQEQGQSLSAEQSAYATLLGYAATHRDWSAVGPLVDQWSAELGRRITLTTTDGQLLAGPAVPGVRAAATVDALNVEPGGHIDPRAVGPYRLPAAERRDLRAIAGREVLCAREGGVQAAVEAGPSGRPVVTATGPDPREVLRGCDRLMQPTPTEEPLLTALRDQTASCLGLSDKTAVVIRPDFTLQPAGDFGRRLGAAVGDTTKVSACIDKGRQSQLRAYVTPPAFLIVTDPADGAGRAVLDLSPGNAWRIAGVTGGVFMLAILVTVLAGRRLVRPLRALTEAARQPGGLPPRLPVAGGDEIGVLTTALNDLSERRERAEAQRQAMVSDVALQLRAPVAAIHDRLAAAAGGTTPAGPELVERLLAESGQVARIIDDLRDLAAAEAGTLRLHPEPIYFGDVLEKVVNERQGQAVRLRCEMAGHPEMTADPVRVGQLLGNVLDEAIRRSSGRGEVRVRVQETGESVRVAITAPTDLAGGGIGLPIARHLARAHGGDLTISGPTAVIRLPLSFP